MALLYSAGNGTYIIDALDVMVSGFNVIIAGLAEIILFMYFAPQILEHTVWFSQPGVRSFRYYALRYAAPVALSAVLVSSLATEFSTDFTLAHTIRWGWLIIASCLALICAYKKK
jgi:SNF family Na+-dependent transporter